MKKGRRNSFEIEVKTSASALQLIYHKMPIAMRLSKGQTNARGESTDRLIKLKDSPYDSFLVYGGTHIAIEMKMQQLHGSWAVQNLQKHQVEGLKAVAAQNCPAYLFLNMRQKEVKGIGGVKKRVNDNCAWVFPIVYWDQLLLELARLGRKSIPKELIDSSPDRFFPVPRIRVEHALTGKPTPIWDLRAFLNARPTL